MEDIKKTIIERRRKGFMGSFIDGLGSLLDFGSRPPPKNYSRDPKSVRDALRGDFERIGADMWNVIGREKAKANEKNKDD